MNHQQFAKHTEQYTINGKSYQVTTNYVANIIMIKCGNYFSKNPMEDYLNFVGDMREYVASVVGGQS